MPMPTDFERFMERPNTKTMLSMIPVGTKLEMLHALLRKAFDAGAVSREAVKDRECP